MRPFVSLCVLAALLVAGNRQDFWRNKFRIVPLHSTRADVERLYGVSDDSCRCVYRTVNETIDVTYATTPCGGPTFGWNVPNDTVLSFTVTLHIMPRLSESALDLNGFVQRYSPEDVATTYYTNVEKGILLAVQDGRVINVKYFPPSAESGKRCEGFPPWDGVPPPRPFATIFNDVKSNVYSRLDNLAFELSTNARTRGYILAYAGKKSRRGEGKDMADDAREYLIKRRMIASDRVIAIDGGFRETAQYDLFSLSSQMPPPTPTPTVPSNKAQIIKPTTRTKRRSPRSIYNYDSNKR